MFLLSRSFLRVSQFESQRKFDIGCIRVRSAFAAQTRKGQLLVSPQQILHFTGDGGRVNDDVVFFDAHVHVLGIDLQTSAT